MDFDFPMHVRVANRAKLALDQIVAQLRAAKRIRFKGKRVTQEAVVNAMWLWIEEMNPKEVEDAMARLLPRLEALMRGDESVAADPPPATQGAARADNSGYAKPLGAADLTPKRSGPQSQGQEKGSDVRRVPKRRR